MPAAERWKRSKRRTTMFSLITAIFSCTSWPTVTEGCFVKGWSASAASVAGAAVATCSAMSFTSAWKSGVLATKSVSQLTSTMTPTLASAEIQAPTAPSAAVRPAFFAAAARPFLRRISRAASMSPLASTSADLQSIIPAPVSSRSLRTTSAVMLLMNPSSIKLTGGNARLS
jgi:hypothetical protein